jgi:UDP-N-acetylglucosamine 3-dehydrogenase
VSLRIALVGSGNMARTHANHWRKVPEATVVAIISKDLESATRLPCDGRSTQFTSLAEALISADFNVVDICTPTPVHTELALLAIAAGKHVFVEKPMARTLHDCDLMIAAAEHAGVFLIVGHVVRFFPEFATAKKAVDAGAVGQPAAIRTSRTAGHPRGGWHNWFADPVQSGGVLLDMAIHDMDWIRWCFGPVERVFAKGLYGNKEYAGVLDYGLVTMKLRSGALAHVTGSWAHVGQFRTTFEICGDEGMLEHDSARSVPFSFAARVTSGTAPGVAVPASPMAASDDPYYLELRHFTDCVLYGATPVVTARDARAAVQIALAALESIETGLPVGIEETL